MDTSHSDRAPRRSAAAVAGCPLVLWSLLLSGTVFGQTIPRSTLATVTTRTSAVEEVRAASETFQKAMAKSDTEALAALWTADGDIIDDSGSVVLGRESALQSGPPADGNLAAPNFRITGASIRLLSDSVAIEDGSVEVVVPGASQAHHGRFSATWVKEDDGWKLAGLREWRTDPAENQARLEDLDWLVGDWSVTIHGAVAHAAAGNGDEVTINGRKIAVAPASPPTIDMSVRWNPTHTYLLRETRITSPDGGGMEISQRIGRDPLTRQIRSWSFGSDGGHSEAVWALEEGSWVSRVASVLPDGSRASTINHYVYDGKDGCTFQSFPTHAGADQPTPVTMTMTRKPEGTSK